ncbi:mandelate racemase/muconate lactonizing enzyme family protein [Variovorax sp. KK3]|uniref:mandelate racemase/muconate lactonizing enzyme family protein n=1 Tax=Variovorax sp. KK3 TaxID=1855728 RepID=UPI00097C04AD|nr:mandelate racemase/muconate lactonizing enzyme family protein [Variovorax sp. KK3]
MKIERASVRQVDLPLRVPYEVSLAKIERFDPFVVELHGNEGEHGFGEALIIPGYTTETVEGSWRLCEHLASRVVGLDTQAARAVAVNSVHEGVGAASAVLAALDMLDKHSLLALRTDVEVPLLAPVQSSEPAALADEIESTLAKGFRTLKVKVGFDWQRDLDHVGRIQALVGERATLRLDANQGFDSADGIAFASRLVPRGIELFEQPCPLDDWRANAAVAARSAVPVMLDESIYDLGDIDRASAIDGVGFVKLKLKKMGSVDMLVEGLQRIRAHGLVPVLGDGVSLEIGCWAEACVAAHAIDNAGEMNGFLKTRERVFENPLTFSNGAIRIPAGYWPRLDAERVERCTLRRAAFGSRTLAARDA